MNPVVMGVLAPHPPLLIPEIGRGNLQTVAATTSAMERMAREVAEAGVQSLVVISPHAPVFADAVAVNLVETPAGDFTGFGVRRRLEFAADLPLGRTIAEQLEARGIPAVRLVETSRHYGVSLQLDHGALVPLYFFDAAGVRLPVVPVAMSLLPRDALLRAGEAIRAAAEQLGRKVAVVASGDLSHRLTPDAPAGFEPEGKVFDAAVVAALRHGDVAALAAIDPELEERAGECGYRSLLMMLGTMRGWELATEVLSYEGPFGVGYCVAWVRALVETRDQQEANPAGQSNGEGGRV